MRRLLLILLATLGVGGLHLWLGRQLVLPASGPRDQWGYVGNARRLSGDLHVWVLPRFPYFTFGYSLALVPAVRLFHDPHRLFVAIKVTNAVLAASMLPLLYLFCRRVLGRMPGPAFGAAVMGALVPPLLAHSSSILAENLVLPLVVATAIACWLFLTDRPAWQRLWLGPAMVLLNVAHNRFTLALPLLFALLVVSAATRLAPKVVAAANGTAAAVLLAGAQLVRNRLVTARWVNGIDTRKAPRPVS